MQPKPAEILKILKQTYPEAKCALNYATPWQLLLATVLSAQCTDVRVNLVTAQLFSMYPGVRDIDSLEIEELKKIIRPTGFFNNKAKSIKGAARMIIADFGGEVPRSMTELLLVPGVARKTANVVLSIGFGINEGVVVDTHVKRLANRLGLTKNEAPVKIEQDLNAQFERADWERLGTLLIAHGRSICKARKPDCQNCVLNKHCPSAFKA